jgi:nucleoside-diphosphate-sugar epimerase
MKEVSGVNMSNEYKSHAPDLHAVLSRDIEKAQRDRDFHPSTELENGLLTYLDWYRENETDVLLSMNRIVYD